ncbi:MAG: hypothetical protein L6408_04710, partial [Nanoarchaeota archaeon]|nr:hypothetical protein [Nanoarchaeota archaeon]
MKYNLNTKLKLLKGYLTRFRHLHDNHYPLFSLILFVTNKCDSGCIGCLYHPKLNSKQSNDLS